MPQKVLMACYQFWDSPAHIGSHHIAKAYLKMGWEVYFLSSPISPLHIFKGKASLFSKRYENYLVGGKDYFQNRLHTYVPATALPPSSYPILNSKWVSRSWWKYTFPSLLKKLKEKGFDQVDLIYFDNPQYLFLLDKIKCKKSVYRIADKHSGFPGFSKSLAALEQELAQSVDLVVYASSTLREHAESLSPKQMFHLPNGVDFEHFQNPNVQIPPEYKNLKGPIVVYVGAIEEWFDFELLKLLATRLSSTQFVLIGPDHLAKQRLPFSNIHILGSRPFSALPNYLRHSDIGIIPFDVQRFPDLIHSVNPLKLYEYLASGLPVVSIEWKELQTLKTPAILAANREEFIQSVERVLKSEKKSSSSVDFAKQYDWSHRVNELMRETHI